MTVTSYDQGKIILPHNGINQPVMRVAKAAFRSRDVPEVPYACRRNAPAVANSNEQRPIILPHSGKIGRVMPFASSVLIKGMDSKHGSVGDATWRNPPVLSPCCVRLNQVICTNQGNDGVMCA